MLTSPILSLATKTIKLQQLCGLIHSLGSRGRVPIDFLRLAVQYRYLNDSLRLLTRFSERCIYMTLKTTLAVLLVMLLNSPAFAAPGSDSRAVTGNRSNTSRRSTSGNWYGKARATSNQGTTLRLNPSASSSPLQGGRAPGNIALMQQGKSVLPPTRLESFVKNSGMNDAIYGDEGVLLPEYKNFTQEHRIETGMNMPDMTTNHRISGPSAWDFPSR